MPCLPLMQGQKHVGYVCVGNEPVSVEYRGKAYLFEWHAFCGWLACNKDGSERLSPVPKAVWEKLDELDGKPTSRITSASKRHVVPCPKCGADYPTVQAMRENGKLICVCSHCGIEWTIKANP